MTKEENILRAIAWNKANPERHRQNVLRCAKKRYLKSWSLSLYDYKLPKDVEIIDYHRCKFNGISYHIGIDSYVIANKSLGKGKFEPHKLHRDIWKYYMKQDIPANSQIHHIDGDTTNNLICNLMCVDKNKHKELHHRKVRA